jgi:hypothetical protein
MTVRRYRTLAFWLGVLSLLTSRTARCDEPWGFGPCYCEPRKTLMQWSYGTSFGGGPNLDEPLVTDRPDFTEASSTVGRGVLQIEAGYTYTYDNNAGVSTRTHSFAEPLVRYGFLTDWLELRFAQNYVEETQRGGGMTSVAKGADDLYLGMKIGLTPQEGWLPEMAVIPQMFVPSGSAAHNAGRVRPGVNWLYGWDVNEFIGMGGSSQFNVALDAGTNDNYLEFAQSFTVVFALTERLGLYTEWFAFFPSGADTDKPRHFFDGGFTYLVNNDLQLDIRAGKGLNDAAEDYFVGTGFSIRFR